MLVAVVGLFSVAVLKGLVLGALSFGGMAAWVVALEASAALVATWSAAVLRIGSAATTRRSAMEAWLTPIPGSGVAAVAVAGLVALPVAGFFVLHRVEKFDWNFLVQNLLVLGGWLLSFALMHSLVRRKPPARASRPFAVAAIAVVAMAGVGAGGSIETTLPGSQQFVPEFVLDAYTTVDPSYRLVRHLLSVEPEGSREFFSYLAANSLIEHVDVESG